MTRPEGIGNRFNEGKTRWSLLPIKTLEGAANVLTFGAEKYGDYNWTKGLPVRETSESLLRHMFSFLYDNEDDDPESGFSHIDHVIVNAIFIKYMLENKPHLDDRIRFK